MARTHKDPDGVGKVIDLFPPGSHKAIERLLKRAREREAREAGRGVKAAFRGIKVPRGGMARLARELGRAVGQRGAGKGRPSIRQVAPGTGGRPFHFAHSVVTKAQAPAAATGKAGAAAGAAGAAGGGRTTGKGAGRAAAHMRYIEREMAVEALYGQGEARGRGEGPGRGAGRGEGMLGEGRERDPSEAAMGGAGAGQGYVENPVKLENGERVTFSFGTIGERFEDRVRFWEALEEAEAHPNARVQHRLIVELPHEASPEARFEIVRSFCRRFEDDGIPFWAALHAPGEKNDSRNFHAHIVYSERPAKRVEHPDRPGETVWDFEVVRSYTKKSRNVVTHRPLRQDKLRSYTARGFIKERRKEFADLANEVLRRDAVRDRKGAPVLYDERSYKAMGVDVVPMRSIDRIVADRARDGATTVLDADYTRRMISQELREAAAKRDKGVLELVALDEAMRAATAERAASKPGAGKAGAGAGAQPDGRPAPRLPAELRGPFLRTVAKPLLKAAGDRILAARHEALRVDVMERATAATLERVIEATSPEALAAAGKGKAKADKDGAPVHKPDEEAARLLREAAIEELAEVRRSAAKARTSARYRAGAAVQAWREIVDAPLSTTSAATSRILAGLDQSLGDAGRPASCRSRTGPEAAPPEAAPARAGRGGPTVAPAGTARPAAPWTQVPLEAASARAPATRGEAVTGSDAGGAAMPRTAEAGGLDGTAGTASSGPPTTGAAASRSPREAGLEEDPGRGGVDRGAPRPQVGGDGTTGWARVAAGPAPKPTRWRPGDDLPGALSEVDARIRGIIAAVRDADPDPRRRGEILDGVIRDFGRHLGEARASTEGRRPPAGTGPGAPLPTAGPGSAPGPEPAAARGGASAEGAPPRPRDAAVVAARAGSPRAGEQYEMSFGGAPQGPPAAAGEGSPAPDPDDARRRRKHDEDQKRRKKRKAVLGRRNKVRTR